jgi:hypothetical protein
MSKQRNAVVAYDQIANALESLLLDAPAAEFKLTNETRADVWAMRKLIDKQLDRTSSRPPRTISKGRPRTDRAEHMALVQSLIASRVRVPARVHAVFGQGAPATDDEIDQLMNELTNLGLLPAPRPPRK